MAAAELVLYQQYQAQYRQGRAVAEHQIPAALCCCSAFPQVELGQGPSRFQQLSPQPSEDYMRRDAKHRTACEIESRLS